MVAFWIRHAILLFITIGILGDDYWETKFDRETSVIAVFKEAYNKFCKIN